MKTLYQYNIIIVLLLSALHPLFGDQIEFGPRKEVSKTISKSFRVSASDHLSLENRYGKIEVENWDRSEIFIEVVVICRSSSESKAQKTLDRITIDLDQSGSEVSAVTNIEDSSSGWFNWVSSDNSDMEINYLVKMPSTTKMDVTMKYGHVYLQNRQAYTNMTLAYGNLYGKDMKEKFHLELKYGDAKLACIGDLVAELGYANILLESANKMNIQMKYGNLEGEAINEATIDSKYSAFRFTKIGKLSFEGGYDNVDIGEADEVTFNNKYSSLDINLINKNVYVYASYHSTKIKKISSSAQILNFEGKYSSLKVMNAGAYQYKVSGKYLTSNIKGERGNREIDGNYSSFSGTKNGGGRTTLSYVGDYGTVSLD